MTRLISKYVLRQVDVNEMMIQVKIINIFNSFTHSNIQTMAKLILMCGPKQFEFKGIISFKTRVNLIMLTQRISQVSDIIT